MLNARAEIQKSKIIANTCRDKVGSTSVTRRKLSAVQASCVIEDIATNYDGELLQGNNRTGQGGMKIRTEDVGSMGDLYAQRRSATLEPQSWHDEMAVNLWRRNYHNGNVIAVDDRAGSETGFRNSRSYYPRHL